LGLAGWQWLFLLEGLPAVLMGVAILILLPDAPKLVTWLTPVETAWIERKLAADLTSPERHSDRGAWRAILNPIVLAFALINVVGLGSYYAFNLSAPQLLGQATHLDSGRVGNLVAVGGVLGAITMVLAGWHSDLRRERFVHLAIPLFASAVAYGVLSLTSDPLVVIGAYWLAIVSNFGIAATVWLAPSDVLAPRSIAVSVAAINSIGQLGSFVSPVLWGMAKDATGSFHLGISLLPIGYILAGLLVLWLGRQAKARRPPV